MLFNRNNKQITITPKDEVLYDYLFGLKDEETIKRHLEHLVKFHEYYCSNTGVSREYQEPNEFKLSLPNKDKKYLKALQDMYQNQLLYLTQKVDYNLMENGIIEADPYWIVYDDNVLGQIALYSNYLKIVNSVLYEKEKR